MELTQFWRIYDHIFGFYVNDGLLNANLVFHIALLGE